MTKPFYRSSLRVLPWVAGTGCLTATAAGCAGMMIDNSHTMEFATMGGSLSMMFGLLGGVVSQQRVARNIVAGSALGLSVFFGGVAAKQGATDPTPVFAPLSPQQTIN